MLRQFLCYLMKCRYWCSAGAHSPGQVVSWTGSLNSQRPLTGLTVHWSYAPLEVKILGSLDGGNFEELLPWRKNLRPEPSFQESFQFAKSVNAKSVTVLMRGPKPWAYFGISLVTALSDASHFMLVSGLSGTQEACVTSDGVELLAKPCIHAITAGKGQEIFKLTKSSELQDVGGKCLGLFGSSLTLSECGVFSLTQWETTADGQLKHGKNCLVVLQTSKVEVRDCDEVAGTDEGKLFQVAVPEYDPSESLAARSIASLLNNAMRRQRNLLAKLDKARLSCKTASFGTSMHKLGSETVLTESNRSTDLLVPEVAAIRAIPSSLGVDLNEFAQLVSSSKEVLAAVR